ncbi:MAG: pentapeptide repeat-containing protein, partial [Candidatus Poribacteria bacterium]|nr:pentapeptide repeat-containing protein [Candidatus Poribacteria bacterium]
MLIIKQRGQRLTQTLCLFLSLVFSILTYSSYANQALQFEQNDDYVQLGATDLEPPWSAEMWVRRQRNDNSNAALLDSSQFSLRLEQESNSGKIGFSNNNSDSHIGYDYSAPIEHWVHLTYVATTDKIELYVNGALQEAADDLSVHKQWKRWNSPTNYWYDGRAVGTVSLPRATIGKSSNSLKGQLDEVRLWNQALSADQVAALWNHTLSNPEDYPNLVAYWNFEETDGDTVTDLSNESLDGLLNGPTRVASQLALQPLVLANFPPPAPDSSFQIGLNAAATQISLPGQDLDGDSLSYQIQSPPSNGQLEGTGPEFQYTPGTDFYGQATFTYTVSDGQSTQTGTVTLQVGESRTSLTIRGKISPSRNLDIYSTIQNLRTNTVETRSFYLQNNSEYNQGVNFNVVSGDAIRVTIKSPIDQSVLATKELTYVSGDTLTFDFDLSVAFIRDNNWRTYQLGEKTDLGGANLSNKDLSEVNLQQSRLIGTNLQNANLTNADLRDADLADADLTGATLIGADLSGANLAGTVLVDVDFDNTTIFPATMVPDLSFRFDINSTSGENELQLPAYSGVTYQTTTPTSGTLSGTAPDLQYQPDTDFYGLDGFTYTVTNSSTGAETTAQVNVKVADSRQSLTITGLLQPLASSMNLPVTIKNLTKEVTIWNNRGEGFNPSSNYNFYISRWPTVVESGDKLQIEIISPVDNNTVLDTEEIEYISGDRLENVDFTLPQNLLRARNNNWQYNYYQIQPDLDLTDLTVESASFANMDLQNAVLVNTSLWSADFSQANLGQANLTNAQLGSANLSEANLSNVILEGVNLENANLEGADLSQANLTNANLRYNTKLANAKLEQAVLDGADLQGNGTVKDVATLSQASFRQANLQSANLRELNLSQVDLTEANLRYATLIDVNLSTATLVGADLQQANLELADLSQADLRNADLRYARLQGANLVNATLTGAYLNQINFNEDTIFPANFFDLAFRVNTNSNNQTLKLLGSGTYVITQAPQNGALTGSGPEFQYTPNTDFYGLDSFSYTVDGQAGLVEIRVDQIQNSLHVTAVIEGDITVNRQAYSLGSTQIYTEIKNLDTETVLSTEWASSGSFDRWIWREPAVETGQYIQFSLKSPTDYNAILATDTEQYFSGDLLEFEFQLSGDYIVPINTEHAIQLTPNVDLSQMNLSAINLSNLNLSGAKFIDSNLQTTNLESTDLTNVDLSQANLSQADLENADLRGANLTDANLSNANLIGANLLDAILVSTNMAQVDFDSTTTFSLSRLPYLVFKFTPNSNSADNAIPLPTYDTNLYEYAVTDPAHGQLTGTAPDLQYQPDQDFYGTDHFAYSITDTNTGLASEATVLIKVVESRQSFRITGKIQPLANSMNLPVAIKNLSLETTIWADSWQWVNSPNSQQQSSYEWWIWTSHAIETGNKIQVEIKSPANTDVVLVSKEVEYGTGDQIEVDFELSATLLKKYANNQDNYYFLGPQVDLSGLDLSGLQLPMSNLKQAILSNADLQNTNLKEADLEGTKLDGANLQNADLESANLQNADLTNADLSYTNLFSANLQGATLDGINLSGIDFNADTVFPTAFVPDLNFMFSVNSQDNALLLPTISTATYEYTQPENGSLSGTGPDLSYTPDSSFYGTDTFTYTANLNGNPLTANVMIRVGESKTNLTISGTVKPIGQILQLRVTNADRDSIQTSRTLDANNNGGDYDLQEDGTFSFNWWQSPLISTGESIEFSVLSPIDQSVVWQETVEFVSGDDWANQTFDVVLPMAFARNNSTSQYYTIETGANLTGVNLPDQQLIEVDLSSAQLANANLAGANLTRANLGQANLAGANLSGANLSGANLLGAVLTNANLEQIIYDSSTIFPITQIPTVSYQLDINSVDNSVSLPVYQDVTYQHGQPTNGTLSGTAPEMIYTPNTDFYGADGFSYSIDDGTTTQTATVQIKVANRREQLRLRGEVTFNGQQLYLSSNLSLQIENLDRGYSWNYNTSNSGELNQEVYQSPVVVESGDTIRISVKSPVDNNTILQSKDFEYMQGDELAFNFNLNYSLVYDRNQQSRLIGANVNLSGVDFADSELAGANLHQARLVGTNFYGANLEGANLSQTDLRYANLERANLAGADLTGADIVWANLTGAMYDRQTILPPNLGDPASRQMVLVDLATSAQIHYQVAVGGNWDDYKFQINGQSAPELILYRGISYYFVLQQVSNSYHLFLTTEETGGSGYDPDEVIVDGVVNNFATGNQTLIFQPNSGTPDVIHYQCRNHQDMGGKILIQDLVSESRPSIVDSSPQDGQTQVSLDIQLSLTFDQEMDFESLKRSVLELKDLDNGLSVEFDLWQSISDGDFSAQLDQTQTIFTIAAQSESPLLRLQPNTYYQVRLLRTNAVSVTGYPLRFSDQVNRVFRFNTGTAPKIVSTSPADGAYNVARTIQNIQIVFDQLMDHSSILNSTFELSDLSGEQPPFVIHLSEVIDGENQLLQTSIIDTFEIRIVFDQLMDQDSILDSTFELSDLTNSLAPLTFNLRQAMNSDPALVDVQITEENDLTTVSIQSHFVSLNPNNAYRISLVSTQAKEANGTPIDITPANEVFDFTTGALGEVTPIENIALNDNQFLNLTATNRTVLTMNAPGLSLEEDHRYRIELVETQAVSQIARIPLLLTAKESDFEFTTGPGPSITTTQPSDGDQAVSLKPEISIQFSEKIDATTVSQIEVQIELLNQSDQTEFSAPRFKVADLLAAGLAQVDFNEAEDQVTVSTDFSLSPEASIRVNLFTQQLKDPMGNPMPIGQHTFNFQTTDTDTAGSVGSLATGTFYVDPSS